jgi:D-sedoheptulose 7-phosphate isomerase
MSPGHPIPVEARVKGIHAACDFDEVLRKGIAEHIDVVKHLEIQGPLLMRVAKAMIRALTEDHKVLWFGNGGSAADSQHLSAELVGRFRRRRPALRSLALTTDSSALTSISNDYGFENVFRRQVEALCLQGDVVVGFSTSGTSKNVYTAIDAALQLGAFTVAFTGECGGDLASIAHETLRIPSRDTARIQEAHIFCGHMLCDIIERSISDPTIQLAE